MKTDFYRSQTELIPTFSLVLAASLIGLNTTARKSGANPENGACGMGVSATARYAHAYYAPAGEAIAQSEQLKALRRFAENLLKETEDSPQAVVDVLNQRFWDLV